MSARDILLAVMVAVLWGFTFTVIHVGLGSFSPLFFSALRFVAAAFPAVLLVRRGGVPWRLILNVGLLFGVAYFALLFLGMELGMPAGLTSLVVQSQAVFTAIFAAIILRDPPVFWQKVGMGVALAGMVCIGWEFSGGGSLMGLVLVIASALTWAGTNMLLKRAGGVDMFRLMVWMSLVPIIPLLALSWVFETGQAEALAAMDWKGAGAILYMGLVATVLCFGIWGQLMKKYPPTVVAPFSLLVPVFGMAFAAVLLSESYTPLKLGASALVFIGLATNVIGRIRYDSRMLSMSSGVRSSR